MGNLNKEDAEIISKQVELFKKKNAKLRQQASFFSGYAKPVLVQIPVHQTQWEV